MTVYSYAQLETLWINAGGPKALAPVAAAIGEAESGGNSDELNPNDNGGRQSSFGIWQISTGTHTPPSPNWANPAVNAQLAVGKWKDAGQSFSPWGTYDSGAYRAFLSGSTTPDPNVPGSPTALTAQTLASGSTDCLVPNPLSVSVPLVGSISAGPSCLFSKSNARAFLGAGLLLAGGAITLAGLVLVAAVAGVKAAGPVGGVAEGVGGALMLVPGAEGAGAALAAGGRGAKQVSRGQGAQVAARRQKSDDREYAAMRRQLGEPRLNPDMEVRGGTVRQTGAQRAAQRRRESSGARARRMAGSSGNAATREETGF
jgi:hypothetical protein